jgi:cell division protein FtsL
MKKQKTFKRSHSAMAWLLVFFVVFMAELLVYSWCRVQYVQTGFEITEARKEHQRLIAAHHELRVENARLKSPERIRQLAQERGLVIPDSSQVFVLP